ncbi:MAG: hypothetical protein ACKPKO_28460, partial [Candidatus Fonsibacter sp.]
VGSKRQVKANNKYLDDYKPAEYSNYIMYWDANNLYGWAMSEYLPYGCLESEHETPLKKKILNTSDTSPKGYIVKVDLELPQHLHEQFKKFPPCPESLTPNIEWFSDYQK